uniref:5-hydroxytryptamine receptor 3A n=1 Tax=Gadus morhua TaxID=8049 RepID=A0A8C5AGC6_GADMO
FPVQCWAPPNCPKPTPSGLLKALSPVFKIQDVRPVRNLNDHTEVSVAIILYGILGVVCSIAWKNEFISWDQEKCGTDEISLPRSQFWVPDLVINEFVDRYNTAPFVPYLHVQSDGMIHDYMPLRVLSSCNLNIYTFPFDVQNCTFTFNSYTHKGKAKQKQKTPQSSGLTKTGRLIIITQSKSQTDFIFQRSSALYVVNLLIPSCFLITVDLFSFLLPPQSVDRSAFKMTLILGYTVFLLLMNDLLPVTGHTIPLINVFFALCLALMVASLLETILITHLFSSSSRFASVPRWVRVVVLQTLGCVGLPSNPPQDNSTEAHPDAVSEEVKSGRNAPSALQLAELRELGRDLRAIRLQVDQQLSGDQKSEEWIQVASIIDRFLFWFYALFLLVSCVTMICFWVSLIRH